MNSRSLAVIALVCLVCLPALAAAEPPTLFVPRTALAADAAGPARTRLGTVRERLVDLNPTALASLDGLIGAGVALELNLFDDVRLQARVLEVHSAAHGYSWTGKLEGEPLSSVVLATYDGVMTGSVVWPGGAYRIGYDERGQYAEEIDQSQFPEGNCARDPRAADAAAAAPVPSVSDAPAVTAAADDGSTIDVLVVYTPGARVAAGGATGIGSLINTAVTETNQGYANSGVSQRIRLAGTAEVSYSEADISTDLTRLTNTADGYIDGVHSLRDQYAADVVVLLGNGYAAAGACGLAWVMTGNQAGFAPNAFSVVDRTCATGYYSFGHEMGHNMGLNHARADYTDSNGAIYTPSYGAASYSFGYKDPGNAFRTVMAYNCPSGGCPRILYFSNPNVLSGGKPTGISESAANSANNAKSLNDTRVTVANWRASVARPQPVWHPFFAVNTLETPMVGDFNGDGKTDVITFTRQNPAAVGDVYVALSNGTSQFVDKNGTVGSSDKWNDWFAISTDETVVIGDYDGDDKDDIATWLGKTTRQVYVARSQGTSMEPSTVWVNSIGFDPTDVILSGDVNGDKKADLVCFARKLGKVYVALSTGTSFQPPALWHGFFAVSTYERPRVADVNGDGRADIVTFATDSPTAFGDVYVAVSNGTDQFVDQNGTPNSSTKWHDWFSIDPKQQVRIGDIDGDGKDDFFTFLPAPMAQCYTVRSLGTSMAANVLWPEAVAPASADIPFVGDVNGDGKADIIIFAQGEGKVYVSLGR